MPPKPEGFLNTPPPPACGGPEPLALRYNCVASAVVSSFRNSAVLGTALHSIACGGMAGTPRGRSSSCEQRDNCPRRPQCPCGTPSMPLQYPLNALAVPPQCPCSTPAGPLQYPGGGGAGLRSGKAQSNCEKLRENCEKKKLRCHHQASRSLSTVSQLFQATLNIAVEVKHEPKAAEVVIQTVLPLGNSTTLPMLRITVHAKGTNKLAGCGGKKGYTKNCEKLRKTAENCGKLRKAADRNHPPPPPLQSPGSALAVPPQCPRSALNAGTKKHNAE